MNFEPSLAAADPARPEGERCEALCELVRNIEMPDTRRRFLTPLLQLLAGQDPAGEHALRTLLHVGTTWQTHVRKAQDLRSLVRLALRARAGWAPPPEVSEALAKAARLELERIRSELRAGTEAGRFPSLEALETLLLEAACLRERSRALADSADPYSMRHMARLLPRLRLYDELADRLELLHRQALEGVSQEPDLGLLRFLGDKDHDRVLAIFAEVPAARILPDVLAVQRRLQVEPEQLSALLTVARTLAQPSPEAGWLERAAWLLPQAQGTPPWWSLPASVPGPARRLLERAGAVVGAGGVSFRLGDLSLPDLLDENTASRDLSQGRPPPPDWKALVLSNITRESLLLALLANPKCVRVPGLVECVVVNCRSVQVLSHVAGKRELHTGHQNRGVPAALLRSRMKVPMNLLRRFIHLRFVPRADLKDIALRAPRAEVAKEVADYLATV